MHQKMSFCTQSPKIFWGAALSPDPFPMGRGHLSPYPTSQVLSLQLDSGYATDVAAAAAASSVTEHQ